MADLRKVKQQVRGGAPKAPESVRPKPPAAAGQVEGLAQAKPPVAEKAAPASKPAPAQQPAAPKAEKPAAAGNVPPAPAPAAKPAEAPAAQAEAPAETPTKVDVKVPPKEEAAARPAPAPESPAPAETSSAEYEVIGSGEVESVVEAANGETPAPADGIAPAELPNLDLSIDLGSVSLAAAGPEEAPAMPAPRASEQKISKEKILAFREAGDYGYITRGLKLTYQYAGATSMVVKLTGKGVEQDILLELNRTEEREVRTSKGVVFVSLTYNGAKEGAKEVHALAQGTASAMDYLEKTRKYAVSIKDSVTWMRRHVSDIIVGSFIAASSVAMLTLAWVKTALGPLHPWAPIGYAVAGVALVAWQAFERHRHFRKEEQSSE